jgi:GDPmannose 4,6-dehydratase
MTGRRALICGVSGQDGAYLAKHLLGLGYEVVGTSRDALVTSFGSLERLGIRDRVTTVSMAINDFRSVLGTLERHEPDEMYNLAGQTSVGLSFEQPVESMDSIVGGTLNLLEAIRFWRRPLRFYNAGSSECFGNTASEPAGVDTSFQPRSPYAVAKASACWLVRNYREAYGLAACTGILFNHESALRPERFVTKKIVSAARRIAAGSPERLRLGNIDIQRDWGWAPEYVQAMHRMLQAGADRDFIVATGRTVALRDFVEKAFAHFGLDWQRHTEHDAGMLRPSDILVSRACVEHTRRELGWTAQADVDTVIARMCRDEL